MPTIKQSVCFNPFTGSGLSPQELVAAAARIGYQSVEMAPEEHWPLIQDHGLAIAIVSGHASLPDGLNKPENHDRIEDELLANIDLAVEYGIFSLICFSGNCEGRSSEEGLANCVAGLRRVTGARRRKRHYPLHGIAQLARQPSRLPVRPHRLGRGPMPSRRLAPFQAALRHLPYADHGKAISSATSPTTSTASATSTRPATPVAKTSTTSRRSITRRLCRPSPPLPTRATSATSTGPRAIPSPR